MSLFITSIHFTRNIWISIELFQIIWTIKVYVRITIRISTHCCVINSTGIIPFCYTVITTSFIVHGHITICIQVLRISLRDIHPYIGTNIDMHGWIFASLGSDKNYSFRGTATIEYHSCRIFQHRYTFHFRSLYTWCTTRHTVYQYQRSLSPKGWSIVTTDKTFKAHKAIIVSSLLCQLWRVDSRNGMSQIFLSNFAESHIH